MREKYIPESELVLNRDGSVYHLHLKGEHIADNVILVGDPGRVQQVADFFESVDFQASNREFVSITGYFKGQRFTVLSTGIGTDNMDIVINELDAAVNIDLQNRRPFPNRRSLNLVRIGTSGGLLPEVPVDSLVISSHGIGLDGLVYYYDYKFSDYENVMMINLNQHLNWDPNLSTPYIVQASDKLFDILGEGMIPGITVTATGFYGPQGRSINTTLKNNNMFELFRSYEYQGYRITNFEMETSGLYALGKLLGHQVCTCCAIIANRVNKTYSKNHLGVLDGLIEKVLDRMV